MSDAFATTWMAGLGPVRTVSDESLISDMERIRSANNVNWMDLMRVALRADPIATRKILRDITVKDQQVAGIIRDLSRNDLGEQPGDSPLSQG